MRGAAAVLVLVSWFGASLATGQDEKGAAAGQERQEGGGGEESPPTPDRDGGDAPHPHPREALSAPSGLHFGETEIHGEVSAGVRWVGVKGSGAQYDEDRQLDTGFVLRDARLEGRRRHPSGPGLDRFRIEAGGFGDPDSHVRANVEGMGLRVGARWDRNRFAATTDSTIHPFDFERQRGSLTVEPTGLPDGIRGGVEVTHNRSDGFQLGSRSVDLGFVRGDVVRRKEQGYGVTGRLGLDLGGFDVALEGGTERLRSRDTRDFRQPSPSLPSEMQAEDWRASGEASRPFGSLHLHRSLADGTVEIGGGISYHGAKLDRDVLGFETGIQFTDPVAKLTQGDVDFRARESETEFTVRWQCFEDVALFGSASQLRHTDHGDSRRTLTIDDFLDPPVPLPFVDRLRETSRLDLFEVGTAVAFADLAELEVSLRSGREDLDQLETVNGLIVHAFDGKTSQQGAEARLTVEPDRTWRFVFEGAREVEPQHDLFLVFDDERGLSGSAGVDWKPDPGWMASARVRHARRTSEIFQSRSISTRATLALTAAAGDRWTARASYSLADFGRSAKTTMLFLVPFPEQLPVRATYEGTQHVVTAALSWAVTPAVRPAIAASGILVAGDSALRYGVLNADLPWTLREGLTVGFEIDARRFDPTGVPLATDFTSLLAMAYLRVGV